MLERTEQIKLNLIQQHLLGLIYAITQNLLKPKKGNISFFGTLETLNDVERSIHDYLESISSHCVTKFVNQDALNDLVEFVNHHKDDEMFSLGSHLATTVQSLNAILYSMEPTCLQSINGLITVLRDFMPVHKDIDYRSFPRTEMSDIYQDKYKLYAYEEAVKTFPTCVRDKILEDISTKYVRPQIAYWACISGDNDILALLLNSLCYNKGQFNIMLRLVCRTNNQQAIPLLTSAHENYYGNESSIFSQFLMVIDYQVHSKESNNKSLFTYLLSHNCLKPSDILSILENAMQQDLHLAKTILLSLNPQITACVTPAVIQDYIPKVKQEEFKVFISNALTFHQDIHKLYEFFWFFKASANEEERELALPLDCIMIVLQAFQSIISEQVNSNPQIESSAPRLV